MVLLVVVAVLPLVQPQAALFVLALALLLRLVPVVQRQVLPLSALLLFALLFALLLALAQLALFVRALPLLLVLVA